jgi:hypothetical protein
MATSSIQPVESTFRGGRCRIEDAVLLLASSFRDPFPIAGQTGSKSAANSNQHFMDTSKSAPAMAMTKNAKIRAALPEMPVLSLHFVFTVQYS